MLESNYKTETFLSKDNEKQGIIFAKNIGTDYSYKHTVVWKNVIGFVILHVLALWGLLILVTGGIGINTFIWAVFVTYIVAEGITTGAHRYFTHRTFKATPLCRAILLTLQTLAGQNCMFIWCRDHRLHHRYSDTDGDPHNSKRGFFFCHMGWLMHKKHPYVIELGRTIDMSDLQADWMVMFQKKYYYPLYLLVAIFIPMYLPVYFFRENWWNSLLVCYFLRYVISLHSTWFVNSIAHLYGTRPYDKNLQPVESWFVSVVTFGEGWHNYHHAFPWDYKAAELSNYINHSATFIEFLEKIGLAYDLKTASPEMVLNRIVRTGDGSHYRLGDKETRAAVTARGPRYPNNNSTLKPLRRHGGR
nr:acyl-CoA Delta-9 desaturase-like [Helicoverpa armigera]